MSVCIHTDAWSICLALSRLSGKRSAIEMHLKLSLLLTQYFDELIKEEKRKLGEGEISLLVECDYIITNTIEDVRM